MLITLLDTALIEIVAFVGQVNGSNYLIERLDPTHASDRWSLKCKICHAIDVENSMDGKLFQPQFESHWLKKYWMNHEIAKKNFKLEN